MIHKRIGLAQYTLVHHLTSRRRVSRPTEPPSAFDSLLFEAKEGAGEDAGEGIGESAELGWLRELFLIVVASFP